MDLEQRLEQLERSNRRMKRMGALVLLVAAAVLLSGAANGKALPDLEVRSLTLRDKDGKKLAWLGVNADGSPALILADKEGKTRVELGTVGTAENALKFFDAKGKVIWHEPRGTKVRIARSKCKDYHYLVKFWRHFRKEYPATLKAMEAPLRPGQENFVKMEDDPWGNEYHLGGLETSLVHVWSWGPDGQKSTEDDISYPEYLPAYFPPDDK